MLGSGGGGDPGIACAALARSLPPGSEVSVVAPGSLPGDATVVPFGFIGATSLLLERPPSGEEILDACGAVCGAPDALIAMEIGGFNGVAAAWAATMLGVPLVDADLMGRALPGIHQLLPVTRGWNPSPVVVVDAHRRRLALDRAEPRMLEAIVRAALTTMGGWAVMACRPLAASAVSSSCHVGTVSRALRFGHEMQRLVADDRAGASPLCGHVLGEGRVVEITRGTNRAGRRMSRTIVVVELPQGSVLRIEAESEWLAVVADGQPVVTVPDLVLLWDVGSREILSVDSVRHGRVVRVVALPGSPAWWEPDALAHVEPAAFSLDIPACHAGAS